MKTDQHPTIVNSEGRVHDGKDRNLLIWRVISENVPASLFNLAFVIDCGAAEGFFAKKAEDLNATGVIACDLNPGMKKRFEEAWPDSRVSYRLEPASATIASRPFFDIVFALNLHMLTSEFLWFSNRLLEHTGRAVIATAYGHSTKMIDWEEEARPSAKWWKSAGEATGWSYSIFKPCRADRSLVILTRR